MCGDKKVFAFLFFEGLAAVAVLFSLLFQNVFFVSRKEGRFLCFGAHKNEAGD